MNTQTTPFNFAPFFKTITRFLPQAEPLLYVQPFRMLSDEAWHAKFGPGMPTACCTPDGFYFNQAYWDGLPRNKQCGLILHEVLHGAFGHLSDPWVDNSVPRHVFRQLSNVAMDFIIEQAIAELNGKIQPHKQPADRDIHQLFHPSHFADYLGLTWRQAYVKLRDKCKKNGQGQGDGMPSAVCDVSGAKGQHADPTARDAANAQRWEAAVKESEAIKERVRNAGSAAGGATLDVKPDEPVIPWQTLLLDFLVAAPAPVNKTWAKVKRRPFGATGTYVPSKSGTSNRLPAVNLLLDTSGSMCADYNTMAAEVLAICAIAEQIHRVDYDVGVAYSEIIEDPEDYEITQLHGGGGTCIRTTLTQLLQDHSFNRAVPCVVITDGGDSYDVADLGVTCVFLTYGSMFKSDAGPVYEVKR